MRKVFPVIMICLFVLLLSFTGSAEEVKTGWYKEGNHLLYYSNGEMVAGIQAIDGKIYEFTEDGFLCGNGDMLYIDKDYYSIDTDGNLMTGFQTYGNTTYYFDPGTGKAWKYRYGVITIEGTRYLFSTNYNPSNLIKDGCVFLSNGLYYADQDGIILPEGYQKFHDSYLLIDEDGIAATGFQALNGKIHYFDTKGREVRGWMAIDNALYYFDPETAEMYTSPIEIDDTLYTIASNGQLQYTGTVFVKKNGKLFAYDEDAVPAKGWRTINGDTYYFQFGGSYYSDDHNGEAITGFSYNAPLPLGSKESYYYFDSEGKMQTGLQRINNELYGFYDNGSSMTGWNIVDNAIYYFGDVYGSHAAYCGRSYKMNWGYSIGDNALCLFDDEGRLKEEWNYSYNTDNETIKASKIVYDGIHASDPIESSVTDVFYLPDSLQTAAYDAFIDVACEAIVFPKNFVDRNMFFPFEACPNLRLVVAPSICSIAYINGGYGNNPLLFIWID